MLAGELYDPADEELVALRQKALALLFVLAGAALAALG